MVRDNDQGRKLDREEVPEKEVKTHSPRVNVIPATKRTVESGGRFKKSYALRVAAYCRVSTGDESQQTSYTTQKKYYSEMIHGHSGWTFAGIYADEAISGTSRAHRVEFNRMIQDAMSGKLDYIVTKSISRFARNTVDTLNCVRELKKLSPPVGIYFEKESIDTLDATGELFLTILSALAQEESRSISDNIRWAIQKNFQSGKPVVNLNRTLGFEKGPQGEWLIDEAQAEIVRYIFDAFIHGATAGHIARELNEAGKRTVLGNRFRSDAIYLILRNEKYVGDLEMQKTITMDFLTHKSTRNTGEAPRYYIRDHHAGIVDRFTWDMAQTILLARNAGAEGAALPSKPALEAPDCGGNPKKRHQNPFHGIRYLDHEGISHTLSRTDYHVPARGYRDQRSMFAEGIPDPEHYHEEYWFNNPIWKLEGKGVQIEGVGRAYVEECALEQAFMELLYALKRSYAAMGRDCGFVRDFEASEPDAGAQERFRFFLDCLAALPEEVAGHRVVVNGLDTDGSAFRWADGRAKADALSTYRGGQWSLTPEDLEAAPHLLPFERGLYAAFIQGAVLRHGQVQSAPGDGAFPEDLVVEYDTVFGVKLTGRNVQRTLDSFLGFLRVNRDGSVELLDRIWKVAKRTICYKRKAVRWKRPDITEKFDRENPSLPAPR